MNRLRKLLAGLLTVVAVNTVSGLVYNGLTYREGFAEGTWGTAFTEAKAYAKAHNIPLVTVWANPGCGYSVALERALGTSAVTKWAAERKYVFVFALGVADNPSLGMSAKDASAAKSFARNDTGEYPYVSVWVPKGASGREISGKFSGRLGKMMVQTGQLANEFMKSVDWFANDQVSIAVMPKAEYTRGEAIAPITVKATTTSAIKSVSASGLPAGLKLVDGSIVGSPTRSGIFSATLKATTVVGTAATQVVTLVVRAQNERMVAAGCDAAVGKVSGAGIYADGKSVTLKATAKTGYVFSAWVDERGVILSRQDSLKIKVDGADVVLTPVFITKAEDLAAVSLSVDGEPMNLGGEALNRVVRQGVQLRWPIAVRASSALSVSVSGLPSGIKLEKTLVDKTEKLYDYALVGVPSTAGAKVIKIKVSTAGKNSPTAQLACTVEPLPRFAYGSFDGFAADERQEGLGVATMTIAASGKISGKFALYGTNWTYSVTGFANNDYRVEGTAKSGKLTHPFVVTLAEGVNDCTTATAIGEGWRFVAHRNVWKDKPLLASPAMRKTALEAFDYEGLMMSISSAGKATFSGKLNDGTKVSASATAYFDEEGRLKVPMVLPWKKGFGGLYEEFEIE